MELHPHNRQRVLRAIEIYEQTGQRKVKLLMLNNIFVYMMPILLA